MSQHGLNDLPWWGKALGIGAIAALGIPAVTMGIPALFGAGGGAAGAAAAGGAGAGALSLAPEEAGAASALGLAGTDMAAPAGFAAMHPAVSGALNYGVRDALSQGVSRGVGELYGAGQQPQRMPMMMGPQMSQQGDSYIQALLQHFSQPDMSATLGSLTPARG